MDKILLGSIIQRLDASDLDPSVDLLVLAACQGREQLLQALDEDTSDPRRRHPSYRSTPSRLARISEPSRSRGSGAWASPPPFLSIQGPG